MPGKTQIMAMTLAETTPRLLLDDGQSNYPDDWSPDGKWILAHKVDGANSIVFLVAADGKSKPRVLFKPPEFGEPIHGITDWSAQVSW